MNEFNLATACPSELKAGDAYQLRRWTEDDVLSIESLIMRNVDHLRPWMAWAANEPMDREDRRAMIAKWRVSRDEANYGVFFDGTPIGACGLHVRSDDESVLHIGIWVDHNWTGKGVATNAVRALAELASRITGVTAVEYRHDRANEASGHVAKKAGPDRIVEVAVEPSAPGDSGFDVVWRKDLLN